MVSSADSVVQWGYSQVGYLYRTGALFTQAAYSIAGGISIPRTAVAQAFRAGEEVRNPMRNLAPGDLVFPTTRIVQLYVGGGYVLTVDRDKGVVRYPVRRVWRAVRITTPGGGHGLALATPGYTPPSMVAGRRR